MIMNPLLYVPTRDAKSHTSERSKLPRPSSWNTKTRHTSCTGVNSSMSVISKVFNRDESRSWQNLLPVSHNIGRTRKEVMSHLSGFSSIAVSRFKLFKNAFGVSEMTLPTLRRVYTRQSEREAADHLFRHSTLRYIISRPTRLMKCSALRILPGTASWTTSVGRTTNSSEISQALHATKLFIPGFLITSSVAPMLDLASPSTRRLYSSCKR